MFNAEKTNLDPVELQQNNTYEKTEEQIKAYKRRWIILFIFIFYSSVNSFQWVQYSVIANIICRYYNVSAVAVDWTSLIYMVLYLPLMIPASYIMDKQGLRAVALIGGLGTTLGTVIKIFSIGQDLFWVVLLGQGILSASQVLIMGLPPRIASVWFQSTEASTACSMGMFGLQMGTAAGFLIPPMVVKNHDNLEAIGHDLRYLCWGLTLFIIPGAIAVIFYFPSQPPKPPNISQLQERNNKNEFTTCAFFKSLKVLLTNKAFNIHMIAYGINMGASSIISTLLNQFILEYFPNSAEDAGRMGLVMVIVGTIGAIVFGLILDKTHKYKEVTLFIYFMSSVSVVLFLFALELKQKYLTYIALGIVGLFITAYIPVGFEFAVELTYPAPESTTTGILLCMSEIIVIPFTLLVAELLEKIGTFYALASLATVLGIGTIITGFIPTELKRQLAFKEHKNLIAFKSIPRS